MKLMKLKYWILIYNFYIFCMFNSTFYSFRMIIIFSNQSASLKCQRCTNITQHLFRANDIKTCPPNCEKIQTDVNNWKSRLSIFSLMVFDSTLRKPVMAKSWVLLVTIYGSKNWQMMQILHQNFTHDDFYQFKLSGCKERYQQ